MKNLLLAVSFILTVSDPAFAHDHYGGEQDSATQVQQEITPSLAYKICNAAQPYTEMTTAQLYEGYQDGVVVITYLGAAPANSHKSLYRVNVGGDVIDVIIDDI